MVIANSDGTKPIAGYSADSHNEDSVSKLARAIKKQLREDPSLIYGNSPVVDADDDKYSDDSKGSSGLLIESRSWTNIQGKVITAGVTSVDEINVVFMMANGKATTYPLANLSEQSQAILKEMTE